MKKLLLIVTLVGATTLPSWASYGNAENNVKPASSFSTLGKSIENSLAIQQALRSQSTKTAESKSEQAFLPVNPYQSYFDQNPLAHTELKIDLDNFDMEYVLKVQ